MNPTTKPELHFSPMADGAYHVYDSTTQRHFRLGPEEVAWLRLLDGNTSTDDLRAKIPAEYFDDFFALAARMGLLVGTTQRPRFDLFKIRMFAINPSLTLNKFAEWTVVYRKLLNVIAAVLLLPNVLFLLADGQNMWRLLLSAHFVAWTVIVCYVGGLLLMGVCHELSHSIVAKSYGITTPAIGMMWFYLNPAFYADVSGLSLLRSHAQRVNVLLAGIMANNVLITVSILAFLFADSTRPYLAAFIILNVAIMLINLTPFIEYDGYFTMLELFHEPDFKAKKHLLGQPRIEYVLYFAISQAFTLAILFGSIAALRGVTLRFVHWSGVNYVCIILMFVALAYTARRAQRA